MTQRRKSNFAVAAMARSGRRDSVGEMPLENRAVDATVHTQVEPMVAAGCIEAPSPKLECAKINFPRFALEHLGSPLGTECDAPAQAALAQQRLDASIVGLVEDLDASLCLWEYQFGHHRANATDYARRCDCRGDARRASAAASAAALRGNAPVGIAGGPKHAGKYEEKVSLRAVLRIEAALRPHARLYDYAAGLFRRRADAVARATGVQLICDDHAPTDYSGAKPAHRQDTNVLLGSAGGGEGLSPKGTRSSWARAASAASYCGRQCSRHHVDLSRLLRAKTTGRGPEPPPRRENSKGYSGAAARCPRIRGYDEYERLVKP